jgi:hypothetical protein
MGGDHMVYFFIGFVTAFAAQSAYRIVKILLANRKARQHERIMESENNKSVHD